MNQEQAGIQEIVNSAGHVTVAFTIGTVGVVFYMIGWYKEMKRLR